jgi:uncharacterized membrane protein
VSGTFGQPLALELAISLAGIALVFGVLLRFGLLSLVITLTTFLAIGAFPLAADASKPHGGAALLLVSAIAALSAFGFYASRGPSRCSAARSSISSLPNRRVVRYCRARARQQRTKWLPPESATLCPPGSAVIVVTCSGHVACSLRRQEE